MPGHLITFAATTQLPLHTAILIGVFASLVLYGAGARASSKQPGAVLLDALGADGIMPATDEVFGALDDASRAAGNG